MHILASLISLMLLALAVGVITVMMRDHWDRIAAALAGAEIPRQVTAEIVRLRVEDGLWRRDAMPVQRRTIPNIKCEALPLAA